MSIKKTTSFKTDDGAIHESIEAAQQHELYTLLKSFGMSANDDETKIAEKLMANKDKIVDVLTMKVTSRPAARKINKKKVIPPTAAPA